ncbi:MAG: precorrin-3B C(17)-methyltransferase [Dehalococcoidia bacterium]|nr:precorrin-3B C(17)-methyltransferase [Dehalococcoidia bacterium]
MDSNGKITMVGLGPGPSAYMTGRCIKAIRECDVVVGYSNYVKYITGLIENKEVFSTGMRHELERAEKAVELALTGKNVAVISSGDSGVFGMAAPILESLSKRDHHLDVEIIPGVPSPQSVAALLGAPLANDYAVISLSDILTPWPQIARRLTLASKGDFAIVLMNPASSRRTWQFKKACDLILKYRKPETPVGVVKNAYRPGQRVLVTELRLLSDQIIDMHTTVIIGNSSTYRHNNYLITPRGYQPHLPG